MSEHRCRYVEGWGHYTREHEATCRAHDCDGCKPCEPEHGHCTARARCGGHLTAPGMLTCPGCIGRTRRDLAEVCRLAGLLIDRAVDAGVDSEAANLAGPAADPEAWMWRRLAAWERGADVTALEDEDPHHPLAVLGRWDFMLREDYDLPTGLRCTVARAADFLDGQLDRLAQDPEQDWALFAAEVHACRAHLEDVLGEGSRPERGAPCPACEPAPPLVKRWSHWCEDPECRREHDATGASDVWRCPACRAEWTEAEYRLWVADDYLDNVEQMTASDVRQAFGIKAATFRSWLHRGRLEPVTSDSHDRPLYDVGTVRGLLRDARSGEVLA